MTACGYCCYYLEHCSKTNRIAIKEVAKYENVFGPVAYQKHADLFLALCKIYADRQICKDETLGSWIKTSYL